MVYWGENFTNGAINITPNMPEFRRASAWGWSEPDGERSYPVASNLGLHVIEHLVEPESGMRVVPLNRSKA